MRMTRATLVIIVLVIIVKKIHLGPGYLHCVYNQFPSNYFSFRELKAVLSLRV